MDIRASVARALEEGRVRGRCADLASQAWASWARLEKPLSWRAGARVVVVGGATLGGSGKTPVAIACAEELCRRGTKVAFVGHAYGASPSRARFVTPGNDLTEVGDEALLASNRLSELGVPVTVAPSRQEALDLALESADVAVIDGVCQTAPRRATLALLAIDGMAPWGAGRCPPRGDLRAPVQVLLEAVDRAVAIEGREGPDVGALPLDRAEVRSEGAWLEGDSGPELIDWTSLRKLRLGLWTAVARPDRVLRTLAERGVFPVVTVSGRDHGGSPPAPIFNRKEPRLDLWLATPKCRAGRECVSSERGVPTATLDYALELTSSLKDAIGAVVPP
jgi:tetraacyldisaccharide 4'-kinase